MCTARGTTFRTLFSGVLTRLRRVLAPVTGSDQQVDHDKQQDQADHDSLLCEVEGEAGREAGLQSISHTTKLPAQVDGSADDDTKAHRRGKDAVVSVDEGDDRRHDDPSIQYFDVASRLLCVVKEVPHPFNAC